MTYPQPRIAPAGTRRGRHAPCNQAPARVGEGATISGMRLGVVILASLMLAACKGGGGDGNLTFGETCDVGGMGSVNVSGPNPSAPLCDALSADAGTKEHGDVCLKFCGKLVTNAAKASVECWV